MATVSNPDTAVYNSISEIALSVFKTQHLPLFVGLIVFTVNWLLCFHLIEEDAYIYFRLAESIVDGNGYRFNYGGETVEAGSSPLWLALLAGLLFIKIPVVLASKLMGYVFSSLALVLLFHIARFLQCDRWMLLLMCLAVPFSIPFVYWTNAGLETPLYTFAILLYAATLLKPSFNSLAVSSTLVLFARPEGFVVVLFVSFVVMLFGLVSRKMIVQSTLLALLIYAAYIAFRVLYFNDLQISPFYAKARGNTGSVSEFVHFVWIYRLYFIPLALLLMPLCIAKGSSRIKPLLILLVLMMPIAGFATANPDFKLFARFYVPFIPLVFLSAIIVVTEVMEKLSRRQSRMLLWTSGALMLCSIFVVDTEPYFKHVRIKNPLPEGLHLYSNDASGWKMIAGVLQGDTDAVLALPKLSLPLENSTFYKNYQAQTGFLIRDIAPADAIIAYDQMGQAAYFGGKDKYYIDLLGLVTKELGYHSFSINNQGTWLDKIYSPVLQWISGGSYQRSSYGDKADMNDYIFGQEPDIILLNNFVLLTLKDGISANLIQDERFLRRYEKCVFFANLVWVYRRQDFQLSKPAMAYGQHKLQLFNQKSCFGNQQQE